MDFEDVLFPDFDDIAVPPEPIEDSDRGNMVLIGVVVDELYAIMSNVPIWGLWTRPGKG